MSREYIKTAKYITTTFAYYSTSYLFNGYLCHFSQRMERGENRLFTFSPHEGSTVTFSSEKLTVSTFAAPFQFCPVKLSEKKIEY